MKTPAAKSPITIYGSPSMNELVSILIPLYNGEKSILATLDSCLNQSYANLEIIVVNDGSKDNGLALVKECKDPRIKWFDRENRGASAARNFALEQAQGKYIQFLDADDLLHKDKIALQMQVISKEGDLTVISGSFRHFYHDVSDAENPIRDAGNADFQNPIDWLLLAAQKKAMYPPMVWLCSRKLIDLAGKWNENLSYNDDSEYFARVLLKADKIIYCEDAVSYYRRGNPNSLGSQKSQQARHSEWLSLKTLSQHLLNHQDNTEVREAIAYSFSRLNYSLYPEYSNLRAEIEQELKQLKVTYPTNFGTGLTYKLGKITGWKTAKKLRQLFKK